ncbi:MAG: D-alanine--D-alanine ligase [Clostridiales bacterium]
MLNVYILMGGISSERNISVKTGSEILKYLDKSKYNIFPVEISSKSNIINKIPNADFVFIALHGEFGEDGIIQAILESHNIKYSGSGILASSICMSKTMTKRVLKGENINTVPGLTITKTTNIDSLKITPDFFPAILKPDNGGSSIGIQIIKSINDLKTNIHKTFCLCNKVLIEKFIYGQEYTIPILNGKLLPIMTIKTKNEFFDYNAKYFNKDTIFKKTEIDNNLMNKLNKIAKKCYYILNCEVYLRVDIIISNNIPYVLEVNTLPGMTSNSLLPKSAKLSGISYSKLLDIIIKTSLNKE